MVERALRLRREAEVRRARSRGRSFADGPLVARVLPNRLDPPQNRYTVIAGKKVGKAVQRNRCKRLVREALRHLHPHLRPGHDIVIVVRGTVEELTGLPVAERRPVGAQDALQGRSRATPGWGRGRPDGGPGLMGAHPRTPANAGTAMPVHHDERPADPGSPASEGDAHGRGHDHGGTDAGREPGFRARRGPLTTPALWLIRGYQRGISPFLPPSCRFHPTCSAYGYEAVARYGILKGGRLTVWRVLRCNPFGRGGFDPVP